MTGLLASRRRVYDGTRNPDGTTTVRVDGRSLELRARSYAPSTAAFDWGEAEGGGANQLALAMLADHLDDEREARRLLRGFVRSVLRYLPRHGWTMDSVDIDAGLSAAREATAARLA